MNKQIEKDAFSIWRIIYYFMHDYSVKSIYLRYYFSGDMWLLESVNPDNFIWLVEDFAEYIPELLEEIVKIAKKNNFEVEEFHNSKYKQLKIK